MGLQPSIANLETTSDSWITLQPLVVSLIGPQTFGLGVVYGMGENVVGGVLGLASSRRPSFSRTSTTGRISRR